MNEEPLVTVVMLQGRTGPWVDECIKSIHDQTYRNIEICVVDNVNRQISIGHGWNKAIAETHGDLIAIVGDDDILHPDYVKVGVSVFLKKPEVHMVIQKCVIFDSEGNFHGYMDAMSADFWRRSAFGTFGPYNEDIASDLEVELYYRLRNNKDFHIAYVDAYTYGKRWHEKDHRKDQEFSFLPQVKKISEHLMKTEGSYGLFQGYQSLQDEKYCEAMYSDGNRFKPAATKVRDNASTGDRDGACRISNISGRELTNWSEVSPQPKRELVRTRQALSIGSDGSIKTTDLPTEAGKDIPEKEIHTF